MGRFRVAAIVQARMGSRRLPGKTLADLAGDPMLARVVRRVSRARHLDEVLVATSHTPRDDPIDRLCRRLGVACFRGSEADVLHIKGWAGIDHGRRCRGREPQP